MFRTMNKQEEIQSSISVSLSCFAHHTDVIYLFFIYEKANVSKIPMYSLSYCKKINLGLDSSIFTLQMYQGSQPGLVFFSDETEIICVLDKGRLDSWEVLSSAEQSSA